MNFFINPPKITLFTLTLLISVVINLNLFSDEIKDSAANKNNNTFVMKIDNPGKTFNAIRSNSLYKEISRNYFSRFLFSNNLIDSLVDNIITTLSTDNNNSSLILIADNPSFASKSISHFDNFLFYTDSINSDSTLPEQLFTSANIFFKTNTDKYTILNSKNLKDTYEIIYTKKESMDIPEISKQSSSEKKQPAEITIKNNKPVIISSNRISISRTPEKQLIISHINSTSGMYESVNLFKENTEKKNHANKSLIASGLTNSDIHFLFTNGNILKKKIGDYLYGLNSIKPILKVLNKNQKKSDNHFLETFFSSIKTYQGNITISSDSLSVTSLLKYSTANKSFDITDLITISNTDNFNCAAIIPENATDISIINYNLYEKWMYIKNFIAENNPEYMNIYNTIHQTFKDGIKVDIENDLVKNMNGEIAVFKMKKDSPLYYIFEISDIDLLKSSITKIKDIGFFCGLFALQPMSQTNQDIYSLKMLQIKDKKTSIDTVMHFTIIKNFLIITESSENILSFINTYNSNTFEAFHIPYSEIGKDIAGFAYISSIAGNADSDLIPESFVFLKQEQDQLNINSKLTHSR